MRFRVVQMWGKTLIRLDVLRHGECQGGEIFRGATDVALSETGWQQMRSSAERASAPWQRIVTSPLRRCREFAEQLSVQLDVPLSLDDDWREMSFGRWEGQLREDIFKREADAIAAFYRDPAGRAPPEGEAADVLQARVVAAYQRILAGASGEHVLIVTHGGVIRALLAHVLGMPLQRMFALDVPYACMTGLHHVERAGYTRLLAHNI